MTITGTSTSVTGMIGETALGPLNSAVETKSFADFQRVFGGLGSSRELGFSVLLAFENGLTGCWVVRTSDVHDGARMAEALSAMDAVGDLNLLCVPGVTDAGVQAKVAAYCEIRRAFALLDAVGTAETADALLQYARGAELTKSDSAALYGPWVKLIDPVTNTPRMCAPSGAVAGVYARTDAGSGVWRAPAGTQAGLTGVSTVAFSISDAEAALLASAGLNAIRTLPAVGAVVWGDRTKAGKEGIASDYKYVPVKRTALYIQRSLTFGLQWAVFEPNGPPLWAVITQSVEDFLLGLFRQGASQGQTPAQSFFVKCDASTTTQANIAQGIVNIMVGFAPLKPAEFVILRIEIGTQAKA